MTIEEIQTLIEIFNNELKANQATRHGRSKFKHLRICRAFDSLVEKGYVEVVDGEMLLMAKGHDVLAKLESMSW